MMCRKSPRCGFCAGLSRTTNDCMVKEDRAKHKCVPCGTVKHSSWDRNCLVRTKQIESARLAYTTLPTLFRERPAGRALATATPAVPPASALAETASDNSGTVPEPQAKRPRGRPRKTPDATTYTALTTLHPHRLRLLVVAAVQH
jgi:hypothetical protein